MAKTLMLHKNIIYRVKTNTVLERLYWHTIDLVPKQVLLLCLDLHQQID